MRSIVKTSHWGLKNDFMRVFEQMNLRICLENDVNAFFIFEVGPFLMMIRYGIGVKD